MRNNPNPFEIYRHFKGNKYQILTLAKDSEDGRKKVVYQALYDPFEVYVRDLDMFMSEVDHGKYPNVVQKYRFELVSGNDGVDDAEKTKIEVNTAGAVNTDAQKNDATFVDIKPEKTRTEEKNIKDNNTEDRQPYAVDEGLMRFLSAGSNSEKLDILVSIKNKLDDRILRSMAMSLELQFKDGSSVEEKYDQVKACLLLKQKYELNRR